MADRYKEGRDYELVPMTDKNGDIVKDGRGGSVKTRRFFTKAEKEAMKAKDKPKAKPKDKPRPSAPKSSAPKSSSRPKQRQTGRGEPSYGEAADKPIKTPMGGPRRGRTPASASDEDSFSSRVDSAREETQRLLKETAPNDRGTTASRFPGITRIANAFSKLKESLPASARADYSSNDEAMKLFNAFKREWKNLGPDAKRDLERVRRMFGWGLEKEGGGGASQRFNKGGMVKKGTRDYKKSGMFYKSGSPRGYK
jgi:hypothetical protein